MEPQIEEKVISENVPSLQTEQVTTPSATKSKKPLMVIILIFIVLILGVGGFFAYKYIYIPKHEAKLALKAEKAKQERIFTIEDKVKKAGDLPVNLSEEEYLLLLSQPIKNPDIKGIKGDASGIAVAYDSGSYDSSINVAIPYIPNIQGSEKVFVRLDSVITNDGENIFDKESGFEDENDMFTDLELERRSSDYKVYLVGNRDVHLTKEGVSNDEIEKISGKIVIRLPINSQSLKLTTADKGVEKQFIGGFLTLDNIDNDTVYFTFEGNDDLLDNPEGYNEKGELVNRYMYSYGGNEKEVQFSEPVSSVVFNGSESVIMKEFPFTIINPNVKSKIIEPNKIIEEDKVVTDQDRELIKKAYFDFGKILDTKSPTKFVEYFKKANPDKAEEFQKEYEKDPNPKDFKSAIDLMKDFMGFNTIKPEMFDDKSTIWTIDQGVVLVHFFLKNKNSEEFKIPFIKTDNVWYITLSD